MSWSFSAHRAFRACQRKWYFDEKVAAPRATKQPLRREVYLLSKLQGLEGWRGSLVDSILSDYVIKSIANRRALSLPETMHIARDQFDRQVAFARAHRLREPNLKVGDHKGEFAAWRAIEYGADVSDDELETCWVEVQQSLTNFYDLPTLWSILRTHERLIAQRTLSCTVSDVAVKATPDLIVFRRGRPPLIIDWKTYVKDSRDHRLQLACYAIALTACKAHADFPSTVSRYHATDIELLEVQLITKKLRPYSLTDEDIDEVEEFITESALQIELAASASTNTEFAPEKYPVAHSPVTCSFCQFQALCWKG